MMNAQFYKWLKADGSAPIGRGKWRPGKCRLIEMSEATWREIAKLLNI
jgi:hypothetical protein